MRLPDEYWQVLRKHKSELPEAAGHIGAPMDESVARDERPWLFGLLVALNAVLVTGIVQGGVLAYLMREHGVSGLRSSQIISLLSLPTTIYFVKSNRRCSGAMQGVAAEEWQNEKRYIREALDQLSVAHEGDRAMDVERVFELAKKAHLLYISQGNEERTKLLRMLCSDFSVDAVNAIPVYRYPFDRIYERAKRI